MPEVRGQVTAPRDTAPTADHTRDRAVHDSDTGIAAVRAVLADSDRRPEDEVLLDDGFVRISARKIGFRLRDGEDAFLYLPWTKVRWIRAGIGWDPKFLTVRLFLCVLHLVVIGYLLIDPAYRALEEARALFVPDSEFAQWFGQMSGFDWFLTLAGTWDYWSAFTWAHWVLVAWLALGVGATAGELARHLLSVRRDAGWLQVKAKRGSIPSDLPAGSLERRCLKLLRAGAVLRIDTESVGRLVKILSERCLARRPLF